MDENKLIQKVLRHDDEAFRELLQIYEGIIYKNISLINFDQSEFVIDKQDLYQEGCLALYNACKTYRNDMNCKFSTFAYILIRRRLLTYYRKVSTTLKNETRSLETISDIYFIKLLRSDPRVSYDEDKERLIRNLDCINGFVDTLSPVDKEIIDQRRKDKSYVAIAASLKINTKTLYNRIAKIRKNYENYKRKLNFDDESETLVQI